jgi:molybdenum cofactor cytidylyltransferase
MEMIPSGRMTDRHHAPLLSRALRIERDTRLAFIGSGGKTTAMFSLARQLEPPVIVTTTTHMARYQLGLADRHVMVYTPDDIQPDQLDGVTLYVGQAEGDIRLSGVQPEALARLGAFADERHIPILLEADGSRRLPLKAPAHYEPVIPPFTNYVVHVSGLSGLGKPFTAQWVHRMELFAKLTGLEPGETITIEALARLLTHPEGALRGVPEGVRRAALLNQADTPELQAQAHHLAQLVLPYYDAVLIASLEATPLQVHAVHERTAGIVLAAGGASRYGALKQLLTWQGEPFVRRAARTALTAGLEPVVVVTGAGAEQVAAAVSDLPVEVAHNPDWEAGQGTSVRRGLHAVSDSAGAAIFLLADQPQIPPTLLTALVEAHARTLAEVVVPMVEGRRGTPLLFDRRTFPELMALEGDTGGRALLSRYRPFELPWLDKAILLDVDTPEAFQRLEAGL